MIRRIVVAFHRTASLQISPLCCRLASSEGSNQYRRRCASAVDRLDDLQPRRGTEGIFRHHRAIFQIYFSEMKPGQKYQAARGNVSNLLLQVLCWLRCPPARRPLSPKLSKRN